MQEIYVDDIGKGYPLVLVHGYLGSSEMWKFQKNYLKNYFRVIAPALPGFGESYKAKPLNSINAMANIVIECAQEKKIDKFNLMGHSMGGMIVQEIAKIAGDKVNKLICFATGSIGNIPDRFESLDVSIKRLKEEGMIFMFHHRSITKLKNLLTDLYLLCLMLLGQGLHPTY